MRLAFHGRNYIVFVAFLTGSGINGFANPPNKDASEAYQSVPGEYVVKLRPKFFSMENQNQNNNMSAESKLEIAEHLPNNLALVKRSLIENTEYGVSALLNNPNVAVAEPNYIYHSLAIPNDTHFPVLWGLRNVGQADSKGQLGTVGVDINAESAWDIQTGSHSVIVGVVDTGLNLTNLDLLPNLWVNQAELNGKPGVDDDGNGYVDDINGYDFSNNDGDPTDDNGHGSHVAGIIGGNGNDGQGVVGVNWRITLMTAKFLSSEGSGTLNNAIRAIDYTVKMGAKILNNSWAGGGPSQLLKESIENAKKKGVLFVAAAGNSSSDNDEVPQYPANYNVDNVMAVAAIDNRGQLADFSNYGPSTVHIAAPGVNIVSLTHQGVRSYSGTSMAAPFVVGVAGLLLAHLPQLTFSEIKSRLIRTSLPLKQLKGRVAGGLVNAHYALMDALPPELPPDPMDPDNWEQMAYNISTEHPYKNEEDRTWMIHVPGAKKITVHFVKLETEKNFDKLTFFDRGHNEIATLDGKYKFGVYSPIIEGDTMFIRFVSDKSIVYYGFDVDHVSYKIEP